VDSALGTFHFDKQPENLCTVSEDSGLFVQMKSAKCRCTYH